MFAQDTEQIIIFVCCGSVFGLELDRVESIIEKSAVTYVPNAPFFAEGIVLHRGNVLPVINLSKLLDVGKNCCGNLLITVRGVSEDFSISVDRICRITPADVLNLKYIALEERYNRFIQGTGELDGEEFSLLDIGIVNALENA